MAEMATNIVKGTQKMCNELWFINIATKEHLHATKHGKSFQKQAIELMTRIFEKVP